MTIHRACSTLGPAGPAPTRRACWTTTTASRTRKPTSARPGTGPARPTGTPPGPWDPPPSGSVGPGLPPSRHEPASTGPCNPPRVDRAARRAPGGRPATVSQGPTTAAALLRTVVVPSTHNVTGLDEQAGPGAEEEDMAVITIQGLTKRFGPVTAVDDLRDRK